MESRTKVTVENVNHPGSHREVDGAMYAAMRQAYLAALPDTTPGITIADAEATAAIGLPEDLFPGGAKAGWWAKTVQLDLEAKGLIRRTRTSPLRLHKVRLPPTGD